MKNTYELFALIGQNMKSIRKDIIGKSQEKMAEDTDMSRSFISHIESPNVDTGISLDTLFFLSQKYNMRILFWNTHLCGLPDLHLLYNGGFPSSTPFIATCVC